MAVHRILIIHSCYIPYATCDKTLPAEIQVKKANTNKTVIHGSEKDCGMSIL